MCLALDLASANSQVSFTYLNPIFSCPKTLFTHNASETSLRVWAYKYDTTSIGLRVFAEYYRLPTFLQCVLYGGLCANSSVS
uniref:Uncharacterized protein n=1 Tax=Globisporangium ultimum (strain ATCC 200006 / CBS 805.95 / DAOM BR144) TaxID=431595 RepID=K3WCP6_GLOUD